MSGSALPGTVERPDPERIGAVLARLSADYRPTPLLDLPRLAARLGIARVLVKDEGRRALGSFKSLGGTYAGLRALARHEGLDLSALLDPVRPRGRLPALICASDGNHGLAVAYAARLAGGTARIFLHAGVPGWRAERIAEQGAEIVRVAGTYDDAVDAAAEAVRTAGILIADTSLDTADPVVRDVMAGYGVIAAEIRDRIAQSGSDIPTHLFVQAGVGGLAAALTEGFAGWLAPPARIVVVEPAAVACVADALARGGISRLPGSLETAAEMLSCGEASAPAHAVLRCHGVGTTSVTEAELLAAPALLEKSGGPATTPSGACGLAGLARAASLSDFGLGPDSRALLVISEGASRDAD